MSASSERKTAPDCPPQEAGYAAAYATLLGYAVFDERMEPLVKWVEDMQQFCDSVLPSWQRGELVRQK